MRVIIAGIVGGLVVFAGGFVSHMVLGWGGRAFSTLKNEEEMRTFLRSQALPAGVYSVPGMDQSVPSDKMQAEMERVAKLYKEGPAAFLVIHPTGEEMMSGMTLGMEALTNVVAALIAAWVASQIAASRGFLTRWFAVLLMGVFAWFSYVASYQIWYRFPWPFVRDELFCGLLEWGAAGFVIALIVRGANGEAAGTTPVASSGS